MRGWAKNFHGQPNRDKKHLLDRLHALEIFQETRMLSPEEQVEWQHCKDQLELIYQTEEIYWKTRSKQQ